VKFDVTHFHSKYKYYVVKMVTGYSNQKLSEIGIWNRGWCYVNIYGTKFLRKL